VKSTPTQERIDAGLVEADYELQPREDVVEFDTEALEEAQKEAAKFGAPHAGVVAVAPSSLMNPNVSEEEQGMEMAPVVVGPPAYGSPDPITSQSRLMPLEQHPLNEENAPEGSEAAISPDYGTVPEPTDDAATEGEDAPADDVNATQGAVDLAAAEGVDLAQVTGTGDGGRITKADVEAHIADQTA
jgi:pyruvate/2-oxoglutarate dehydrogenase complex dihydrolipoamide acyltransferase (E2) component